MGLGRFLRRVTTPHKSLRGVLGNSFLDEIGTVGGFALGGPQGAAIGRGLGRGMATGKVGDGLRGAVEGYAMGTGAKALGMPGGSMSIPGLGGSGGAGGTLSRLARGAKGFGEWATASPERTALVTSGLGTAAGAYGGHVADRAANRDAEFSRGRATRMDPARDRLMQIFMERLGGARAGG
jgi:hypothetical protein